MNFIADVLHALYMCFYNVQNIFFRIVEACGLSRVQFMSVLVALIILGIVLSGLRARTIQGFFSSDRNSDKPRKQNKNNSGGKKE